MLTKAEKLFIHLKNFNNFKKLENLHKEDEEGFSLLDMVFSIVIIGVLFAAGGLGVPSYQSWQENTELNVGVQSGYASAINSINNQWDNGITIDEILQKVGEAYPHMTLTYTGSQRTDLCVTGVYTDNEGKDKHTTSTGACGDTEVDEDGNPIVPADDEDGTGGDGSIPDTTIIEDKISTFIYQCDATTTGYLSIGNIDSEALITIEGDDGSFEIINHSSKDEASVISAVPGPYVISDLVTMKAGVTYRVLVNGQFGTLSTYSDISASTYLKDCLKIVENLAEGSGLTTITAFAGPKLVDVPDTIPTTVFYLTGAFAGATNFNDADVSAWDVSKVVDMERTFLLAMSFDQPLNNWATGNVKSFAGMFQNAILFNQDISTWDTSYARTFESMFSGAVAFNQPLNTWDVRKTLSFENMFNSATSFNQPLNNWEPLLSQKYSSMFENATSFNSELDGWNMSEAYSVDAMFKNATSFNQPLNNWTFSKLKTTSQMFMNATSFDENVGNWNLNGVTRTDLMFSGAVSFNKPLNSWNMGTVKNARAMFQDAAAFNQPLNNWNMSEATNLKEMFMNASNFNQPLNNWDVSKATDLRFMFQNAGSFNGDLTGWDVSNATYVSEMFMDAVSFNQPLSSWNPSSVKSFSSMFQNARVFNQDLSSWGDDTGIATNFNKMFKDSAMTYDLSGWDVSNAVTASDFKSNHMSTTMVPSFP